MDSSCLEYSVSEGVDVFLREQKDALSSVYAMQIIPAGAYAMGCTDGQADDCFDNEFPLHAVVLTQPYLIGETEVTQGLYESVMGRNPSPFASCGPDCPVDTVSWNDAVAFANALSVEQGLNECYHIDGQDVTMPCGLHCGGFRLPTEAEWEVAARGGEDLKYSGSDYLSQVAWHANNSNDTIHPVAQKQPNGYGLYDMSGNVWELVWDTYDVYSPYLVEDPAVTSNGYRRVVRGGSWSGVDKMLRTSYRDHNDQDSRYYVQGFRLVLAAPSPD